MSKSLESNTEEETNNHSYALMRREGLNYIEHQQYYLFWSMIFPIFSIIVLILNFFFILNAPAPPTDPDGNYPSVIAIYTPILISLVISVFTLTNAIFLINWKRKVQCFENQQTELTRIPIIQLDHEFPERNITLTRLFYDIIHHIENIRKIFIVLNLVFIFYLLWFFVVFINTFIIHAGPHPPVPNFIMEWLNVISQIGLLIYIVYEWKHFIKWNGKLSEINAYEQIICSEVDK